MRVSKACVCVCACMCACVGVHVSTPMYLGARCAILVRACCARVKPLAVHGVQKLMSNVQEAFAPAPGKVKPWENIAPTYPLMKLVRPPAVPRASLALPATAQQSLALSARQVEAAFTYLGKQTKQFAMAKPPQAILGAVLFECVEMYAPLPSLSTP